MATADTIKQYFVNILQRDPTAAETAYWVATVDSNALTLIQVRDSIAGSAEAKTYVDQIVRIYQAAFGRKPDVTGIDGWTDQLRADATALSKIAAGFVNSQEWKNRYGDNTVNPAVLQALYVNVLGRVGSADEVQAWINTGQSMTQILIGFSNSLEFTEKAAPAILALKQAAGDVATSALNTVYTGSGALFDPSAGNGKTYDLTTGIDNFVGTAANDTFNATNTATSAVLGGLDKIDGAGGVDTFNVADTATAAGVQFALPAGFTMTNIEVLNVSTNGGINMDVSGIAGLTTFKSQAAGTANTAVTAAKTTDVTTTVSGAATTTITGGKAVSVTAGTGAVSVVGNDLTSVSVKGGNLSGANSIDNGAANKTLKSVTIDTVDTNSSIRGAGIETVTVTGATTAGRTVTITNGTADHAVTLNAIGTGYDTTGAEQQTVFVDAAAKTISVNATGAKSSVSLAGNTAATAVNVTGSAALKLNANLAGVTKIDGSAATGDLNLGTINAATTSVKTGSGKDSFSLGAAKVTVETGAGDDTVTLTGAIAAESTITLGAGNDKLLNAGGSVATSTKTVIDAGDGVDSVSASLINAGNAGQFKNFELLDISAAANLDVDLMTGSTITGLTLSGAAANATVSNVAKGAGLSISGDNTGGTHTINVKGAAAATDDTFAITFAGAAATTAPVAATIKGGTTVLNGIETISIASSGGANTWNSIAITDDKLKVLTITGDKNLDLTFVGANGTNDGANGGGVNSIDGSAATGKLNINTANVTADNKAGVGLTVKGGSANDTITLAQKAVVMAGDGDDVITVSANGGTLTGGAGNDKFDVSAAVAGNVAIDSAVVTGIADFTKGDTIQLAVVAGATTFVTTKVDISTATNLQEAVNLATATNVAAGDARITWFNYGSDTYVVQDLSASLTLAATDVVVKLTGVLDLSTAAVSNAELLSWA